MKSNSIHRFIGEAESDTAKINSVWIPTSQELTEHGVRLKTLKNLKTQFWK